MPHRTSRSIRQASAVRKNAPVLYRLRTLSRTTTTGSRASSSVRNRGPADGSVLPSSTRTGTGRRERREIDGVRHRLVSGVVGMQPVAGLEILAEFRGLFRIAHHRVEVDDAVVFTAGPDPLVEFLPPRL